MNTLTLIQSKLYDKAFNSPDNILVCAPTGAGKTNIAMLTILQCIESRRRSNNTIDLKSFKIVYVAPMKALVSEVVGNF
jgi:pre-mRNA-splicing helicase BRR2